MIEIEMTTISTLRDMQLLMRTLGVSVPIPVSIDPNHCYAVNQDTYGPVPATTWVIIKKLKNDNVLYLNAYKAPAIKTNEE